MDLIQREHPRISAGTGVGYGKTGSQRIKPAISLKRLKMERKLLLTVAYIKWRYGNWCGEICKRQQKSDNNDKRHLITGQLETDK